MAGAPPSPVARSARILPTTGVNLKPCPEKPAPMTTGPIRSRIKFSSTVVV